MVQSMTDIRYSDSDSLGAQQILDVSWDLVVCLEPQSTFLCAYTAAQDSFSSHHQCVSVIQNQRTSQITCPSILL